MKRTLSIFIILLTIFFTGCWSSHEVNNLAVTICIGIDKTENGYIISEQILNPRSIASKKATNEAPVFVFQEKGYDIYEAIQRFTTQTSRRIYNSHLRMVVFSEEVAKDGIEDTLDFFLRNHQYRTDFYFVVAKDTTASEVLSILTPIESIPGIKMYDSLNTSEKTWAPTKSIRIVELVNSIIADGKNPVLTGIEIIEGETNSNSTESLRQSNEIKKLVYTSLGAFKKDKLVGWLNEEESKGYNYITGNVKSTVGHVYYGNNIKITHKIISAKSKVKASLVDDEPAINVGIDIKANVSAVKGQFDVSKKENKKIQIELAEKKVKELCDKTLNKVQKELKTDIFGFGEVIHRQYPKVWNKIKDDWNTIFPDIPVKITVNIEINQLGEITKSMFLKEKE